MMNYEDITLKKSTMKLMNDNPFWWIAPFSVSIALGLAAAAPFIFVAFKDRSILALLGMLILAVFCFIAEQFFHAARSGKRAEYEFDKEKMTIRREKRPDVCYYYSDVRSVEIKSFFMGYCVCGYKVTIETKYKTDTLYYAFEGAHNSVRPEDTPFAVLGGLIPEENKRGAVSMSEYNEY